MARSMYTKNTDYDTKQIARDIYNQLRLDYRYNKPTYLTLDEAIKSLNEKLKKLKYREVLCWSQALIDLGEVNTGHPPTAQEIIKAIKKAAFRSVEEASYYTSNPVDDTSQIDYSCLWADAGDKGKYKFIKTIGGIKGVWKKTGGKRNSKLKLLVVLDKTVTYRKRFAFYKIADGVARARFQRNFYKAMQQAITRSI